MAGNLRMYLKWGLVAGGICAVTVEPATARAPQLGVIGNLKACIQLLAGKRQLTMKDEYPLLSLRSAKGDHVDYFIRDAWAVMGGVQGGPNSTAADKAQLDWQATDIANQCNPNAAGVIARLKARHRVRPHGLHRR